MTKIITKTYGENRKLNYFKLQLSRLKAFFAVAKRA